LKDQYLGKIPSCQFANKLVIALDEKWIQKNNNQPLVFDVKIENGKIILEAQVSP